MFLGPRMATVAFHFLFHRVEHGGFVGYLSEWCHLFYTQLKHTDPHTVRGRPTLKDGLCNERIFRNGLFRELKIAKESNDLAKVSLESIKAGIFKSGNL